MILLEVHADGFPVLPLECHAPGTVHRQAVTSGLAQELVEVEARDIEIRRQNGLVEDLQPQQRSPLQVWSDTPTPTGLKELAEPWMPEASNHRDKCRSLRDTLSSVARHLTSFVLWIAARAVRRMQISYGTES